MRYTSLITHSVLNVNLNFSFVFRRLHFAPAQRTGTCIHFFCMCKEILIGASPHSASTDSSGRIPRGSINDYRKYMQLGVKAKFHYQPVSLLGRHLHALRNPKLSASFTVCAHRSPLFMSIIVRSYC